MKSPARLAILLVATLLLAGCTGGGNSEQDTDGDGLRDTVETRERDITIRAADGTATTRTVTSDPEVRDTDGDGLEDLDEFVRGTDPRDVDTDSDGLLDGEDQTPTPDVAAQYIERDILQGDDGRFLGELGQCPEYGGLKSADASSDRPQADNLSEGEEIRGWNITVRDGEPTHVTSDPCIMDTDGDGVPDHEEKRLGSHPRERDTDNDGVEDVADADPTWDLSLLLENITVNRTNGNGTVALSFAGGSEPQDITAPGNDTLNIPIRDQSPTRDSLVVPLIVSAHDPLTGEPIALFDDERGIILTFDLIKGTVSSGEGETPTNTVTTQGEDGRLTFTWRTHRS